MTTQRMDRLQTPQTDSSACGKERATNRSQRYNASVAQFDTLAVLLVQRP